MTELSKCREAIIRKVQDSCLPGESQAEKVRREVWILQQGSSLGPRTRKKLAEDMGFCISTFSNYLWNSGGWRSPKLANVLRDLGVLCCGCGSVDCDGCKRGAATAKQALPKAAK